MNPIEKRYRPRLFQALKMHLVVTTVAVGLVMVMLLFQGMYVHFIEDPVLATIFLLIAGLSVGAIVLAIDILKFKKRSAREIALTSQVFQIEMANGRRLETRWGDIQSAASDNLIWTIVTTDEEIAFSVAGLTYREQDELGRAIAEAVAQHRNS